MMRCELSVTCTHKFPCVLSCEYLLVQQQNNAFIISRISKCIFVWYLLLWWMWRQLVCVRLNRCFIFCSSCIAYTIYIHKYIVYSPYVKWTVNICHIYMDKYQNSMPFYLFYRDVFIAITKILLKKWKKLLTNNF